MPASTAQFPIIPDPAAPAAPTSASAGGSTSGTVEERAFLGYGLLRPFVRERKTDWANAGGRRLVRSAVGQILGTRAARGARGGELPWRPEFGSLLHVLRFHNNDEILADLARVHVADAIQRWESRVRVRGVQISKDVSSEGETILNIRVTYDLIQENTAGNNVLLTNQFVDVPVAA